MKITPFKEINPPNKNGYWVNKKNGQAYGGAYISPLLIPNLERVEKGFKKALKDKKFIKGLEEQLLNYIGVNTPILFSEELTNLAGGKNKIGPALYSVLGRNVAALGDYKYSKAFVAYGKSWTFEEMDGFLKKPQSYIKGTKMAFAGLKKEKDRASVILFMNQNSDNPLPLP